MSERYVVNGGSFFDGKNFVDAACAQIEGDTFVGFTGSDASQARAVDLNGDILCPPFVDLQVNGGGGVNFNDDPSPDALERISAAHSAAGTGALMPTLITDAPEKTVQAIDAVAACKIPQIVGLHLEGPHIAAEKKGAHQARFIRPLDPESLQIIKEAATRVPHLLVTLAPEAAAPESISALVEAGVIVSLGHSAAQFSEAQAAFKAGATMATHLFNAMGPLHHREPGLAGAALSNGSVSASLIADGLHVHPALMGAAVKGKAPPGELFLVSDAMAPFGTSMTRFQLGDREVTREGNCLSLSDGTLAGANTDLLSAVRLLVTEADVPLATALRMATGGPSRAAKLPPRRAGRLVPGSPRPLRISKDLKHIRPITGVQAGT